MEEPGLSEVWSSGHHIIPTKGTDGEYTILVHPLKKKGYNLPNKYR